MGMKDTRNLTKLLKYLISGWSALLLSACTVNSNLSVLSTEIIDSESPKTQPNTSPGAPKTPPEVQFEIGAANVSEGAGSIVVKVSLSSSYATAIAIPISISGSSTAAAAGVDYSVSSDTAITFIPGETSKDYLVTVVDDSLDEQDEMVVLNLSAPSVGSLGQSQSFTLTITDDDVPPSASFSLASQSVSEIGLTATITVQLDSASGKAITVPYSVDISSTASDAGVDYSLGGSSLSFTAGETSKSIPVSLTDDGLAESDETIILNLGTPTNATVGDIPSHTLALVSDDIPPSAPTGLILGTVPTGLTSSPTLSWTGVSGASYYQTEILDESGAIVIGPVSHVSGNAISALTLTPYTTYTIKVRGVDTYGNIGAWSSTTWTSYCDAFWSSVALALELNGTNGSTTFTDSSSFNVTGLTATGQASLSTTQKFNGSASAYFDGIGDYINVPASNDWKITGDYTVEARIYITAGQLNPIATATGSSGWEFYVSATGALVFNISDGGLTSDFLTSAAGVVSASSWHHVAAVKSGNSIFVFIDGTKVATRAATRVTSHSNVLRIGGTSTSSFKGYIDDVRITKATARYTGATYTVPTNTLTCTVP
jgi:hypothetical protein